MKPAVLILLCLIGLSACHASPSPGLPDLAGGHADRRIRLEQVQRVGVVEHAGDGVAQQRYAFQPAAHPQIVLAPATGIWNWSGQGALHLRVQNAMPWVVTLRIEIDGVADGRHLQATVGVPAGPAQTVVAALQTTSPRQQGMQVGPPMPFDENGRPTLLATTVEGQLDLHQVSAIRLEVPAPQAVQTLLLGAVRTAPGTATLHDAYADIVDRYGQFSRASWPEKIATDAALQAAVKTALAVPPASGLDAYGG